MGSIAVDSLLHGDDAFAHPLILSLAEKRNIEKFCVENDTHIFRLLEVSWAILLQSYEHTDTSSFALFATTNIEAESPDTAFNRQMNCVGRQDLLQDVSILHLLQGTLASSKPVGRDSPKPIEELSFMIDFNSCDSEIIILRADYKPSRVTEWQASCLLNTFNTILSSVLGQPERNASEIELLGESEWSHLMRWNQKTPETRASCVHHLVSEQASLRPNAQAVASWDGSMTYAELDELSSRLSYQLIRLGVKAETMVPLRCEKSLWAVVGRLAILKAGGACLTLDPAHPIMRQKEMIQVSNARIVLATKSVAPGLEDIVEKVVILEESLLRKLPVISEPSPVAIETHNTAFVVFTSGSTGKPKGIRQSHEAFCSGVRDMEVAVPLDSESRVLQFSAYSFDISNNDIFATLACGGCVCIPSEHDRMNNLVGAINTLKANTACLTPTVANLINPEDVPGLEQLTLAGEAVTRYHLLKWSEKVRLSCLYGPAEAAIWATWHPKMTTLTYPTNIGWPATGRCWIVSPKNHEILAPLGSVGEILIEGPHVGDGYIGDTKKTDSVFLSKPEWYPESLPINSAKFYLTGDLAHFLEDGSLVYHGRKDTQVKVAGQRIELQEIEYHLRQALPETIATTAEVIVPDDGKGKAVLAAFLSFNIKSEESEISWDSRKHLATMIPDIENSLSRFLPSYMIPSVYIPITRIPMTTTGKTDRKALRSIGAKLRAADFSRLGSLEDSRSLPTTPVQIALQKVVAQILGIETNIIGLDDHFFRLGGDSVAAIRMVTAAREQGIAISVADIFQNPTLSQLARVATSVSSVDVTRSVNSGDSRFSKVKDVAASLCRKSAQDVEDIYSCTSLQQGLMALSIKHPGSYISRHIMKLANGVDPERFRLAWERTVRCLPILRTRIIQTGSDWLQVVLHESVQWSHFTSTQTAMESPLPDIKFGERLHYSSLVGSENGYQFVWTAHHSLFDGWSLPLIFDKLKEFYDDTAAISIDVPSVTTASFSQFLRYIEGVSREESQRFWSDYLAGASSAAIFPENPSRYQPQPKQHMSLNIDLPEELSSSITTSTLIRAAWAILSSRYCASDSVVFGTTLAGRNVPIAGIEHMIAPTITTVPVHVRLNRNEKVEALLDRLQSQAASIIEYEHTGLQNIKKFSADAETACGFQCLLIVNPRLRSDDNARRSIFSEDNIDTADRAPGYITYAITLECDVTPTGLIVTSLYDSEVIENAQMRRVLFQFQHILRQLGDASHRSMQVGDIEAISPQDLLELDNWEESPVVRHKVSLSELVEVESRIHPELEAVTAWDGTFSYAELNNLATHLSDQMFHKGAPPTTILLCFERSAWSIVAMLASLKVGGSILLLDLSQPISVLQQVVSQVSPSLVLTSNRFQSLASMLTDNKATVMVVSEAASSVWESSSEAKLQDTSRSLNSRFILASSSKISIHQQARICADIFQLGLELQANKVRTLQRSSLGISTFLEETFVPLLFGGCVCIPSDSEYKADLFSAIQKFNVDLAFFTPSVARKLPQEPPVCLKSLVISGEASLLDDLDTLKSKLAFYTGYKPAPFATIISIARHAPRTNTDPIGRPLTYKIRIVDSINEKLSAPIGAVGELVLYEADKESDVRPQSSMVYKTGHLVRYGVGGAMELYSTERNPKRVCGNIFRPERVEASLRRLLPPNVDVAVFSSHLKLIHTDLRQKPIENRAEESPSIIAIVGFPRQEGLVSSEIIAWDHHDKLITMVTGAEEVLSPHLPPSLQPQLYVPVWNIPKTAAETVDRLKAQKLVDNLTEHEISSLSPSNHQDIRKPSSPMEIILHSLWTTVLNLSPETVGLQDHFFRCGGDSISAMRLVSAANAHDLSLTVGQIFEHPTLQEMAKNLQSLSNEDAEPYPFYLLEGLVSKDKAIQQAADACGVSPSEIEDMYPASPLQEGLLALSQKSPGAYKGQHVFKLHDTVELSNFQRAWQAVVETTPILRTRLIQDDVGCMQVVIKDKIHWEIFDGIKSFRDSQQDLRFGSGDALSRSAIIETSGARYFAWVAHHALYDGWSLSYILEKVAKVYAGFSPETTAPFSQFIQHLSRTNEDEATSFWTDQLNDASPCLFPRQEMGYQVKPNAWVEHEVPVERKEGSHLTVSTFIRAAWALLLSRYTDSTDIVFGATVSGRNAPVAGIEKIVGPTIATVPVRQLVAQEQTILDYLEEVQTRMTTAIPYEQTGIQKIQRISSETRKACEFGSLLVVQPSFEVDKDQHKGVFSSNDLTNTSEELEFYSYPITLVCHLGDKGFKSSAIIDSHSISEEQMLHVLHQLDRIMQQLLTEDAQKGLAEVDLLSKQDLVQIMEWNKKAPDHFAVETCIPEEIAKHTASTPDDPAICSWDGDLTYAQLDNETSKLAQYLKPFVAKSPYVPICFEKSKWAMVSMVAIMRAGGAYVPLDPNQPPSRLLTILEEIRPGILLTSKKYLEIGIGLPSATLEFATTSVDSTLFEKLTEPFQHVKVRPEDAAYVLFTSGSTGVPKGVIVEHRNICSSIRSFSPALYMSKSSRNLQFSAFTFDSSVAEMFGGLVNGGCVCIPSEEERMNDLPAAINRMRANWSLITPTVARLYKSSQVPCMETLALGGEAVSQDVLDSWQCRVMNAYGPTECSVISTTNDFGINPFGPTTIGFGSGCRTWIVDTVNVKSLKPIGLSGELLIEGPIVSRGYLDPEKTRKAFIEAPEWLPPSNYRRLYRTGDLVQYNTDGSIKYLGRIDSQVKVRGQRMEVGEVEYHLRALDFITEVLVDVVTPSDRPQEQIIIAFITYDDTINYHEGTNEYSQLCHKLQAALAEAVPRYMIPSVFVRLEKMPLNPSGKANRKELRIKGRNMTIGEMSRYMAHTVQDKRPPTSPLELILQDLWRRVLKCEAEDIGLDDNFFQLGGDSVGAMKLVAAARGEGLVLTVSQVFQYSSLERMAHIITRKDRTHDDEVKPFSLLGDAGVSIKNEILSHLHLLNLDDIEDIYPCTPLQEGLIVLSTRRPAAYMDYHVIDLHGLDIGRFKAAWEKIVRRTSILRTSIVETSFGCFQVVLKDPFRWHVSYDLDDYLKTNCIFRRDLLQPLNQSGLIQSATGEPLKFVWIGHHSIYDGWTIRLIFDTLDKLYYATAAENEIFAGARYNQFIQHMSSSSKDDAAKYWRSQLADANPTDFPARVPGYKAVPDDYIKMDVTLPKMVDSEITVSTIVRAAWSLLLSQYCGADDVVFAATLAGRTASIPGIDSMFGPTMTTLPIRIKTNPKSSIGDFLREVQSQAAEMMPYEQFGLRNIKGVLGRSEAQAACESQHLLVIQPLADEDETNYKPLHRIDADTFTNETPAFHTYPLTVDCFLTTSGMRVWATFDSKVIETSQMRRVLNQLVHVVHQLADINPELSLASLEFASPQDKTELQGWFSEPMERFDSCVHQLISQRAFSQPDAQAVCAWDGTLTYSELDNLSSRLACHLLLNGVSLGMAVPLCFEKSLVAVISRLAVLKAGGCCVSLDPSHPRHRQENILQQSQPGLLLVSPDALSKLDDLSVSKMVIDKALLEELPEPDSALLTRVAVKPTDKAFIVFTSGSTGTPKGIIHSHAAFCSSARDFGKMMKIDPTSRVLQFAAYTFDVSNNDTYPTLIHGGCICIPSEEERINRLPQAIERLKANTACLTPTVANLFGPSQVPGLHTLALAGEAIMKENIDAWAKKVRLMNIYGPAECAVWCSCDSVIKHPDDGGNVHSASIGRSVTGRCWIVDPANSLRLSPNGCVGEVLIEGPHLSDGYLNNEEKTNSVFLRQPSWFEDENDCRRPSRFYLTGDLARYDLEGNIIYLGRKDTQVKIAGQRIELEEVEHHIRKLLPAYLTVSVDVIISQEKGNASALAAFVAFDSLSNSMNDEGVAWEMQDQLTSLVTDVRDGLSKALPSYMLPSLYVPLWKIPLSPSGKTDRKQLRQLATKLRHEQRARLSELSSKDRRLPTTHVQKILGKLWMKILGRQESIALDDQFFQLGGDSVSAMRLVAAARTENIVLTVAQIFENSTLEAMANVASLFFEQSQEKRKTVGLDLMTEFSLAHKELMDAFRSKAYLNVFLTGGTGYLGNQILRQLLARPDVASVIVHVRASTIEKGLQRIVRSARLARWWDDYFLSKIQVWLGDLSQPKLGLKDDQWAILDGKVEDARIDAIVHNGAVVNWNKGYEMLKAANVQATMDLLKATITSTHPTKFIFVSGGQQYLEQNSWADEVAKLGELDSAIGYTQTKYLAELMVKDTARLLNRDIRRVSIIKPGLIIGTVDEGVANLDDFIWRVVATVLRVGGYIAEEGQGWLAMSSVDDITKRIVKDLDIDDVSVQATQVLRDGLSVQQLWDIFTDDLGYTLKPMGHDEWLNAVHRDVETDDAHPIWPVLHFIEEAGMNLGEFDAGRSPEKEVPRQIRAAVLKNVEYLVSVGFLQHPDGRKEAVNGDGFRRG